MEDSQTGGGGGSHESGADQSPGSLNVGDKDMFLPSANVTRIMQSVLPPNTKIAKDAKDTMLECTSEFISLVTCELIEKCKRDNRKTINGDDLLWVMTTFGFEHYIAPLRRYRELEGDNKGSGKGGEPSALNDAQPSQVSQLLPDKTTP